HRLANAADGARRVAADLLSGRSDRSAPRRARRQRRRSDERRAADLQFPAARPDPRHRHRPAAGRDHRCVAGVPGHASQRRRRTSERVMSWFRQLAALIGFNLRTLPARFGSAAAAVFGVAGVVAVLVGVLSIGEGFRRVMIAAGSPDTAIVLRGGADSEMTSVLLRDDVELIRNAPAVARAGGQPLASPELFVLVDLAKRSTGT